MRPFCDYLGISTGEDQSAALHAAIEPHLDAAGFGVEAKTEKLTLWRHRKATVKAQKLHRVWALGTSGKALERLREVGGYDGYLEALGRLEHHVTGLHATIQRSEDAPTIVRSAYEQAKGGNTYLAGRQVSREPLLYWHPGADGRDTGTVYLNPATAEVRAVVYDKRQERIAAGESDPGELTRWELRLRSKVGATLEDAANPTRVFYHYMAPSLVAHPRGVESWEKAAPVVKPKSTHGTPGPGARLEGLVGFSQDIGRAVRIAASAGGGGHRYLAELIQRRYECEVAHA